MTRAYKPLRFVGDEIPYTVGRYEILLQWVRPEIYRVTITRGTVLLDDQSESFTDELGARHYARNYALSLKAMHAAGLLEPNDETTPEPESTAAQPRRLTDTVPVATRPVTTMRGLRRRTKGATPAVMNAVLAAFNDLAELSVYRGRGEGKAEYRILDAAGDLGLLLLAPRSRPRDWDHGQLRPAGVRMLLERRMVTPEDALQRLALLTSRGWASADEVSNALELMVRRGLVQPQQIEPHLLAA